MAMDINRLGQLYRQALTLGLPGPSNGRENRTGQTYVDPLQLAGMIWARESGSGGSGGLGYQSPPNFFGGGSGGSSGGSTGNTPAGNQDPSRQLAPYVRSDYQYREQNPYANGQQVGYGQMDSRGLINRSNFQQPQQAQGLDIQNYLARLLGR